MHRYKSAKYLVLALTGWASVFAPQPAAAAQNDSQRLSVNIVVSSLRAGDLKRYSGHFGEGGFRRLLDGGTVYDECYLEYAPTTSAAGLATIATGANPSAHGIVSRRWFDRTSGKAVELCVGTEKEGGRNGDAREGVCTRYTNRQIMAQTLAETVVDSNPKARAVTIAHTPQSAILLAGRGGECYWLDKSGNWATGECYANRLPIWVQNYNESGLNGIFASQIWYGKYQKDSYLNKPSGEVMLFEAPQKSKAAAGAGVAVHSLNATPAGNVALLEFAKRAAGNMLPFRRGEGSKVLNICLDVPRRVAERYGSDSAEYEDMLGCLDSALEDFLTFLYAQVDNPDKIVVTLTADSGISRHSPARSRAGRFNVRQFEVIANAFLSATFGQDQWVLQYVDNSLYLNHDTVRKHRASLDDIRAAAANFALQFGDVANAVSASALHNGVYGDGIMRCLQNGFNARRSGDAVLILAPDCIEEREGLAAMSGSPYNYDRHIPLIIYGGGAPAQHIVRRTDITSLAPTLAYLLGTERPASANAPLLGEITGQ